MDLERKLNNLVSSDLPEQIQVRELTDTEGYKIEKLRRVQTKYGRSLVATVLVGDQKRSTFLPKRYDVQLSEADIEEINSSQKYRIVCLNPIPRSPDVKIFVN